MIDKNALLEIVGAAHRLHAPETPTEPAGIESVPDADLRALRADLDAMRANAKRADAHVRAALARMIEQAKARR